MSDDKTTEQDLGVADEVTMDAVIRKIVASMFENDNDTAYLNVTLKGTDSVPPPQLELKVRLISINGTKTRPDETEEM